MAWITEGTDDANVWKAALLSALGALLGLAARRSRRSARMEADE